MSKTPTSSATETSPDALVTLALAKLPMISVSPDAVVTSMVEPSGRAMWTFGSELPNSNQEFFRNAALKPRIELKPSCVRVRT